MEKKILESLSGIKQNPRACSTHLFTYCKFNREFVFQILGGNDTFYHIDHLKLLKLSHCRRANVDMFIIFGVRIWTFQIIFNK